MFDTLRFHIRNVVVPMFGTLLMFGNGRANEDETSFGIAGAGNAIPSDTVFVIGTVRNATTGIGIAGVKVSTFANVPITTRTIADGTYRLEIPHARRGAIMQVRFSKPSFTPFTRDVQLNATTVRIDALLSPASSNAIAAESDPSPAIRAQANSVDAIAAPPPAIAHAFLKSAMPAPPIPYPGSARMDQRAAPQQMAGQMFEPRDRGVRPDWNREQYDRIEDNPFLGVNNNPRSTFSIDVDRASYGNVRRYLNGGAAPPADAVRIEEMVNYFPYKLAQPKGTDPIAITTEVAAAPWQSRHKLVRIALQARRIESEALPPANLVFLIDVSGSMDEPDKLPLVKESLRLLVNQLREQDHVALVAYAGNAGLVLPSTAGSRKARIAEAIDRLDAGGSTAGGAGLELAYRVAKENFLSKGNNRVILATDGDFNVGASSDAEMERLTERKRIEGTYLTVLGFGTGNIQDAKMQKLAKKGNGNYAYVDNIAEARKTLVHELGGTLYTVANDVKLQIEFNPAAIGAYRLIGYENRLLRGEDFTDDRKDAGDMGAGHTVTALYEIIPAGVHGTADIRGTDSLRYSKNEQAVASGPASELMYVKLRYKKPGESTSKLMTQVVSSRASDINSSDDFRFAASVASFGMLLRNSEYKGDATSASVMALAKSALGEDAGGYRSEFLGMVQCWQDVVSKRGVAVRDR